MKKQIILLAIVATAMASCKEKRQYGIDLAKKTVTIGYLNDVSGPAAAIGKPFAVGKKVAVAAANAGDAGLLPAGWKIVMVERDHGYNPQKSVEMFKEIKDQVYFIGQSFGTPNTLPLKPLAASDRIVVFPASLSSEMAKDKYTPPLGASYEIEAMRAAEWMAENAGGAAKVKAGIVYQNDDYGKDGLNGFRTSAKKAGVAVVSEQSIAPGQKDFIAVVSALKDKGATHVFIAVLPSATGPIMGTALKSKFMPKWIGSTPVWVDAFFNAKVIPSVVFTNYYQVSGLPFWGEKVPGMDKFIAAFDKHSGGASKDSYVLLSYIQGMVQIQALKIAIEKNTLTRDGYLKAVQSLDNITLGGMIEPIKLSGVPYQTSVKVRVLRPDFKAGSWQVISPYKKPSAL